MLIYSNIIFVISTDDGLSTKQKHVLEIEKHNRFSSGIIQLHNIEKCWENNELFNKYVTLHWLMTAFTYLTL